jgi:pyridoxal phosphate enzyme (YggS family)
MNRDDHIATVFDAVRRAAEACGRNASEVRIVAAAKGQGEEGVRRAAASGVRLFGHNYVQEAQAQAGLIKELGVEFHMIGRLQKNKAGKAVELFTVIHTVDDESLAVALNRRAGQLGAVRGALIQVNAAGEPQKGGIPPDRVEALACVIRSLPMLRLMGLMTMPPFFDDPERARPYFAQLRELRDRLMARGVLEHDMNELSMGMSGDFEAAIEEGATLVRIGTALFGPRPRTSRASSLSEQGSGRRCGVNRNSESS